VHRRDKEKEDKNLNVLDMYRSEYSNLKLAKAAMGRGLESEEV
jgi:hypothetical protein